MQLLAYLIEVLETLMIELLMVSIWFGLFSAAGYSLP
tara:strand:- start:975 stop:1085 length:111 start_codon:yes stop_codon:yes gene_type:complete